MTVCHHNSFLRRLLRIAVTAHPIALSCPHKSPTSAKSSPFRSRIMEGALDPDLPTVLSATNRLPRITSHSLTTLTKIHMVPRHQCISE
ncbi:hypothetical protein Cob_v002839 [Colletotrichum orbiculare MAFF 240422]|uniref:Uncharacterized protein n=1 Tax=Colletotrichum orbiculare (strain 104-T / ATCC 96160 / CBS 514.97 / LARS 414 / MAFF 240422) TaxID=1213857 RepID=A0A484G2E2_COLOR|nr:hypothetical protein Cob_v002839 [Colletotrichum orbiculare MAFF 240422]